MIWLHVVGCVIFCVTAEIGRTCDEEYEKLASVDATTLQFWFSEHSAQRSDKCRAAASIYGTLLLREQRLDDGVQVLRQALRENPGDWVASSYSGAAHELLARRLATHSPSDDGYKRVLEEAVALFRSAAVHRKSWLTQSAAARLALPHAVSLAQPATYLYRSLSQCLLWLGRADEALEVAKDGVQAGIGWTDAWARPAEAYPLILSHPVPFFDATRPALAGLLQTFELALPMIRDEFHAIMQEPGEGIPFKYEAAGLHKDALWSVLLLGNNGRLDPAQCKRAPITCATIRANPLTQTRDGQVKFSVMRPGTHVLPHCGPTNARLRLHCALTLFHGGPLQATFRVGNSTRHWETGEGGGQGRGDSCFVFDESFEHEVWAAHGEEVESARLQEAGAVNGSGRDMSNLRATYRAVLLVDIANPYLSNWADFSTHAVTDRGMAAHRRELVRLWRVARTEVENGDGITQSSEEGEL